MSHHTHSSSDSSSEAAIDAILERLQSAPPPAPPPDTGKVFTGTFSTMHPDGSVTTHARQFTADGTTLRQQVFRGREHVPSRKAFAPARRRLRIRRPRVRFRSHVRRIRRSLARSSSDDPGGEPPPAAPALGRGRS